MTGLRKTRARVRSLKKYQNSTDSILSFTQRGFFSTGFNMGWRQGKKRQLQICNGDISNNIIDTILGIYKLQNKRRNLILDVPDIFFNNQQNRKEVSVVGKPSKDPADNYISSQKDKSNLKKEILNGLSNTQQPSEFANIQGEDGLHEKIVFNNKTKSFGFKFGGTDFKKSSVEVLDNELNNEKNPAHFCMGLNCKKYLGYRGFCCQKCHDNFYDEVFG